MVWLQIPGACVVFFSLGIAVKSTLNLSSPLVPIILYGQLDYMTQIQGQPESSAEPLNTDSLPYHSVYGKEQYSYYVSFGKSIPPLLGSLMRY